MPLPFLDRRAELSRLRRFGLSREGGLAVVYGRRRCGKSRLLHEALRPEKTVYYLADEREPPLQRSSVAREITRAIPGFEEVRYPDWDSLFQRWWDSAPPGMTLVLDEFPALVSMSREVPGTLQRHLDRRKRGAPGLILC